MHDVVRCLRVRVLGALVLAIALAGCGNDGADQAAAPSAGLTRLAQWMSGTFSSAAQAEDTDDYVDIRLVQVPIWTARGDGPWLYVEQALASGLDKPYRQRVYQLRHIEANLYESRVFTFPEPEKHVGAGVTPDPLHELTPADLTLKRGCTVVLRLQPNRTFAGGTLGTLCANRFGGAAYATSFVTISQDGIEAWDRGYAEDHKALWGPESGPYRFIRQP